MCQWISRLVAVAVFLATPAASIAEDIAVRSLNEDENRAISGIEESEVLATVAFLASDEMAGRNTPSTELDIAAAYVVARFRGAGLEGLGPDGSFYQTTELTQFAMPEGEATVLAAGQSITSTGVLFGGAAEVSVTATTTDGKVPADAAGKIVVLDEIPLPPQAVDNPMMLLATWSRRLAPLANNKAAVILVRVADDSILPEAIRRMKDKPISLPPQFMISCPVVLIPAEVLLDGEVTVKAPAQKNLATPVRNVIGVLRGSDPELARQAIIITAHLDHIGRLSGDRQGDVINNGADDNATGVTGVVMLADAFAQLKARPGRSVVFMTFWGEEKGLLGSKYFADHPLWALDQTVANINLEMIGRPEAGAENKAWGTGWNHSTLGEQMAAGAARADVTIFHHDQFSEMLYARSDNFSFVKKGVIAHSFSAGSLHSDYHQPGDEISKLNIPHMTQIIKGLFAGSLPIAHGELTPQKSDE